MGEKMSDILWLAGILAAFIGALAVASGVNAGDYLSIWAGAGGIGLGINLLLANKVIETLIEIRDRLPEPKE